MPAATPTSTGMKPWLRVVFGLSLALNLLVLGLVLGVMMRFGFPGGDRPPPPTGVSLVRALPSEDRRAIRDHLRETLPPPPDRLAEANDLAGALSADPYDPAALETVVDAQAAHRVAFQVALKEAWMGHIAEMDAADRAAYAERLLEYAERGDPPPPRDDDDRP